MKTPKKLMSQRAGHRGAAAVGFTLIKLLMVMADKSARWFKGDARQTDWCLNHSYEGWDSDEPPPEPPL